MMLASLDSHLGISALHLPRHTTSRKSLAVRSQQTVSIPQRPWVQLLK